MLSFRGLSFRYIRCIHGFDEAIVGLRLRGALINFALTCAVLVAGIAYAQQPVQPELLQPGEAYVTRFSGTTTVDGKTTIDFNGTVGSVVDLRNPSQPPQGHHWLNEPQRHPITAAEAGQIFGVALDDASSPNIYLTATSAFGLHRTADNANWVAGMWGPGGNPGTVWKVSPESGYKPVLFANIGVVGRANTGAALGNIAYDKWHKQLYVSDLETGLIHRLQLDNGTDLGQFDHGVTGRALFTDAAMGEKKSLPTVAFDPATAARITNCPDGDLARTPSCWNFADFRRRVWGLGVRQDPTSKEVRLYYAIWSSQALGSADFASASDEEKRNSAWSVAINDSGGFDETSVRREFLLPDFFIDPADIARAGRSNPVSDIAFCKCKDEKIMLLAERGGVRNSGLDAESPFASPHEARVLSYELDDKGKWQPKGRYDAGHYDRKDEGQPFLRANSSGGVDFGYGYGVEWHIDSARPDETVWLTGGTLCTPTGPCFSPDINRAEDGSYVGGAQGIPIGALDEVAPPQSTAPYPNAGTPYPATGPLQSYVLDTDKNLDADDTVIMAELMRNNSSKMGDISVYELCSKQEPADQPELVDQQPELVDQPPELVDQPPGIVDPPVIVDTPPAADMPDLEMAKTGPAQCAAGGICTFTVTITNRGPGVWSGPLQATDTLPPGATLWNFNPPDWMCTQGGGAVNCTSGWVTLNPGDAMTLTIDVLMPAGAAGPVDNCIQTNWLPGRDPNDPAVMLAIEQALNAGGNQVGAIDGVLDVVTQNGIRQLQANNGLPVTGVPDPDLGQRAIGRMDGGGLPVTGVPDQAVIDLLFGGNAAMPGDGNPGNDLSCATVNVLPAPPPLAPPPADGPPAPAPGAPPPPAGTGSDLQAQKIQTGQCGPGAQCTFDLWFVNRGPDPWTGVPEVTDTLPAGAVLVPEASAVGCSQAGSTVTCRYPQQVTLPPNEPAAATVTVRMPDNLQPGMQNCAEIAPAVNDPSPANNRRCIPVEVAPDLQTRKVQRTAQCRPGGLCDFELWFINRGPGPWTGRLEIVDTLPDGATFVSTSGGSICTQAEGNLTCRNPREVTLAAGSMSRLVVTVRMPRNAQSGARNCVAIADALSAGDANPANNRECINVRISPPPPPDIQVLKNQTTNACTPGESCTFDLWFINRGPGTRSGTPRLTDTLPEGATFESASAPWTCQQSGRSLACNHGSVKLPAGRAVKVSVTVRLPADMPPNTRNCVSSAADGDAGHDPVPQNNERCITIRTTPPPEPEGTEPTEPHEPAPHEPTPAETPHEPTPEETAPEHPPEPPAPAHAPPPAQPADTRSEKKQLGPCKPGHSCLFELKFVNKGPGTWSGRAKLSDLLPDPKATLGTWSPSTWKCAQNGTSIGCEHSGATVAPGEHLSVSVTVKLPDHLPAGAQNCVVIERPEIGHIDPHLIGDRQCVTIDVATPGFAPRPPKVVHPSKSCPHGTVKDGDQCVTLACPVWAMS